VEEMSDDKTEIAIDKLLAGKKLTDADKTHLRVSLNRNSRVSKAIIWAIVTTVTAALGVFGAQLAGLI